MRSARTFWKWGLIAVILLGLTTIVVAHGGAVHVLGTVTEVNQERLVVQTKDRKTVTIHLSAKTQYKPVGKGTTGQSPAVGDRVVVEATKSNDALTATEVRFSSVTSSQNR